MRHSAVIFLTLAVLAAAQSVKPPAPQVTHPPGSLVKVNGANLWYESEGQGEPLILISGGPGDSHGAYHPFFSQLAAHNRVIYYDPLGVGRSARPQSNKEYSFARDVEDLEGLRKALNLGAVNIYGHSYGSMVAQAYALKYPQSVRRLILGAPFHSGAMWQANDDSCNEEIRKQFPEVWDALQKLRAKGMVSSAPEHQRLYGSVPLGLFYFHDASKADLLPSEASNQDLYYQLAGPDADFHIGGDIAALDFRPRLAGLKMPMLVIAGRFDRVSIPRLTLEYRKFAPAARFVMMENSGHFSFLEEPEKTLSVLREFLAGKPAQGSSAIARSWTRRATVTP